MESERKERMRGEIKERINKYSTELIMITGVVIILLLMVVGLIAGSTGFALGVLVGGGIAVFNHAWLYKSVKAILSASISGSKRGPASAVFGFYVRLIISAVVIVIALKGGWADPIAILIGASVVVIASVIIALIIGLMDNIVNNSIKDSGA